MTKFFGKGMDAKVDAQAFCDRENWKSGTDDWMVVCVAGVFGAVAVPRQ